MVRAFTVPDSGRVNHPPRPTAAGWRNTNCPSKSLRCQTYQGMPLRSGAFEEGSGRSPAMRINVISRTPANPPPTNATKSHHNETICCPRFLWFREIAKDRIEHPGRATDPPDNPVRPMSLSLTFIEIRKKSGTSPDGCYLLRQPRPKGTDLSYICHFERAGRKRVLLFLELDSLRALKKSIRSLNPHWLTVIIF